MQIAILYSRYGLYEEAQLAFDSLNEIAPDNSAVQTNQGNLYLLQADYDKAIMSYQQAVKLDDKDGGIWLNMSMAKYRKGDLTEAAKDFQIATSLKPELKNTYAAYRKLLSQ
jgi:tetratricopeptide (TPR) repeat protein